MDLKDLSYQKRIIKKEKLLEHLNEFNLDLKISVGIWYLSSSSGRFHDAYMPKRSIEERIEIVAEMVEYGVKGVEAHYPTEVNDENLHLYKELERETGIRLLDIGPQIFYDTEFEFGSFSNTINRNREKAIDILVKTLKFAKKAGCNHVGVWPGMDGYLYPLGTVFYEMWDSFEDAVATAMDEVPGVRIAIEPKPYEPVPNNIYRTTVDGLLACRDIESRLKSKVNRDILVNGHVLLGMQPEIGHIRMGFEDAPYAFSRCARQGRLIHTHWNSQPLGNYDQDLNIGVVEWQQAEAALYALKMIGYKEYFGIDINPERMPVQKAIEINSSVLHIMNERINALPNERILECYFDPENNRGKLELILANSMRLRRV